MKTLTAIKNVTMNEPQFQGHFPDLPVMPGVLIIEAMAQACGTLAILSEGGRKENDSSSSPVSTTPVSNAKSSPGDQLVFEVELLTNKRGIGKFNAVAKVDGQVAVEAVIMCAKRVV